MVDITPIIPADRQVIDTYAPGHFRVSNVLHSGAIIVFPDRTVAWPVPEFAGLTVEHFAAVLSANPKPEVLLLGSGARMQLLPSALRKALREQGVVVDIMDSPAACRTYNVLLAEGRLVAAALLAV
ncbi:Mth938-like domain-containing protein [Niveispirillum sp.]|uniref:Mth938-like domain-containing protein n=1 Tax=Niveispirillum sp. TaxID=1917217 RepID=UPI001B788386|nr:Mth938-like domain-containing protein [Niveispirillum sp.]MBP7340333.1 Mth938-like domain-containing protein [Niveispirillum sp.]